MKIATLIYVTSALYATKVDNQGFYASRDHQFFKSEDVRTLDIGNVPDDDVPYMTWTGFISGQDVYFEVHGTRIKIRVGRKKTALPFNDAPALGHGGQDNTELDASSSTLYVKSAKYPSQSMICVESLGPDKYTRPRPYWEVYLLADLIGKPRLYRLSGINASCKGIERLPNGKLVVPIWDINKQRSPSVVINYYSVEQGGYRSTDLRFTGEIASDDAHEYVIRNANKIMVLNR